MKKTILYLSFITVALYVCIVGLLYIFQRDFLYFPTEKYNHSYERFSILSQKETIEVIVLNKGNNKALLYFGGNGEAVVANADEFSSRFSDTTIYLINYRGYGGSSGKPSESGIYADALAVYDNIENSHQHISVVGRSLGSGVASYVATQRPVKSTILITPFDSALNVAKTRFSILPVKLLLKDRYDSLSRAPNIKSIILIIAAEHDQIIPMKHTQRLINAFDREQISLKVIKNVGHNDLSDSIDYYQALSDFL